MHWPIAHEKGADVHNTKDKHRLGYDPDREAKCWEVHTMVLHCKIMRSKYSGLYSVVAQ